MRAFEPALEAEAFTLLIADADTAFIAAVRAAVPRNWRCLAAVSARMAWHVLDEVAIPDLALIGISLPDGDGFSLLSRFPENPSLTGVPVVLVAGPGVRKTGEALDAWTLRREGQLDAWRRQAFAMSADFLAWPCSIPELRMRIGGPLASSLLRRKLAISDQRLAEQLRNQADQSAAAQSAALAALASLSIHPHGQADSSRIERLTGLCRLLASRMAGITAFRQDITPAYLNAFCQAIPLHDIGWLASQSTQANAREDHSARGARVLEQVRQAQSDSLFLKLACELAGAHHENWDGSGHPNGLSGRDIPLSARILSLSDAYDALRSGRSGQPALSHAQAVGRLSDDARHRFDPRILDCFLFYEQDFESFSAEYHLGPQPERMDRPDAAPEKKAPGPQKDGVPAECAVYAPGDDRTGEPAHPGGIGHGSGALPAKPAIRQGAAS